MRMELDQLRESAVSLMAYGGLVVSFVWAYAALLARGNASGELIPPALLAVGMGVVLIARGHRSRLAGWIGIGALVVAQGTLVRIYPGPAALFCGVPAILIARSLYGVWAGGAITGLIIALNIGLRWLGAGLIGSELLTVILLYALTWLSSALAGWSRDTLVHWSLSGWQYANHALEQVRQRRAELYRVTRALDEANYRIERTNRELSEARRRAEEAFALKSRFAATVSHELRGPLNLVLGFSRMIAYSPERYEEPLPACSQHDVLAIHRSTQHLVGLVDDILDLSQIEAERLPLLRDHIDVDKDVVAKVAAITEPLAAR